MRFFIIYIFVANSKASLTFQPGTWNTRDGRSVEATDAGLHFDQHLDLKLVEYAMWRILQDRVCKSQINDIELRQRIEEE